MLNKLLLASCAVYTVAATAALLDFFPSSLELNDYSNGNTFSLRLTAPVGNVTVFFSGYSLWFGVGHLTFTNETFDIPQTVQIRATTQLAPLTNQLYNLNAAYFLNCRPINVEYKVSRTVQLGGTCSSVGDPHIQTFTGKSYTSSEDGVQNLFTSKDLTVQTVEGKCTNHYGLRGASCNNAFALRYGSSVFVLDVRKNYTGLYQLAPNVDGVSVRYETDKNTYFNYYFTLPDGSSVTASVSFMDWGYYINVQLSVAPYYSAPTQGKCSKNKYGGACNRINASPSLLYVRGAHTPYVGGDAVTGGNVSVYLTSWKATESEVLFNGFYVASKPLWRNAVSPALPASNEVPAAVTPPTFPTYTGSYSLTRRDTAAVEEEMLVKRNSVSDEFMANATNICTALTQGPCGDVVEAAGYINSCTMDAITTGSHAFAQTHGLAFLQECYQITAGQAASSNSDESGAAQALQLKSGFGTYSCPKACSGRGTCTSIGCVCKSGFFGTACDSQLTSF